MYVHGAFNYLIHREKQISYIHTYLFEHTAIVLRRM